MSAKERHARCKEMGRMEGNIDPDEFRKIRFTTNNVWREGVKAGERKQEMTNELGSSEKCAG